MNSDSDTVRIMDALRRVVRALRSAHADAEVSLGVGAAGLFVLRQIASQPGQSMQQLARRTNTAQSSVSEVVARLARQGLVAKAVAPGDRRKASVELTAEGEKVTAAAGRTVQEQLIAALEEMPEAKRRALAGAFEGWLSRAGLDGLSASMFFEEPRDSRVPTLTRQEGRLASH